MSTNLFVALNSASIFFGKLRLGMENFLMQVRRSDFTVFLERSAGNVAHFLRNLVSHPDHKALPYGANPAILQALSWTVGLILANLNGTPTCPPFRSNVQWVFNEFQKLPAWLCILRKLFLKWRMNVIQIFISNVQLWVNISIPPNCIIWHTITLIGAGDLPTELSVVQSSLVLILTLTLFWAVTMYVSLYTHHLIDYHTNPTKYAQLLAPFTDGETEGLMRLSKFTRVPESVKRQGWPEG